MIHPFDDYPIHQSALPLLHPATESNNQYDRCFYNGYPAAGPDGDDLFFAAAFGVYPNKGVMDAAFSVVRAGTQHNVRASRRSPDDRTQMVVGPITIEVVEPMRVHRIVVDGRHGLAAELTYTAVAPVIEEPRFTHVVGTRTAMDYTRITQFGSWSGWIDLDGERIAVGGTGGPCVGVRDRSWGVRPIGERAPGPPSVPQFFWIWTPTVFADAGVHAAINHDGEGRPWHQSGAVVPRLADGEPVLDPGRVQRAASASADIVWERGTRWAERVAIRLAVWNGDPVEVSYEPFRRFQMSGVGYLHPTWGHGCWVGEDESNRDAIELAAVNPADPTMVHVQAVSLARWGDRVGLGVVEQLALGAHAPTGLRGFTDGFA